MNNVSTVARAAADLRSASRVLAISGAGLSADSGLPTYRGVGGLYDDRLTDDQIPIEEALSGAMLRSAPEITWRYVAQIERSCRGRAPNAGHHALVELESMFPAFCVLTQNIDGFHRTAGSRHVIEMHGDLLQLRCLDCHRQRRVADYSGLRLPPRCRACGGTERPGVVLFGEMLPEEALGELHAFIAGGFDAVLSIGTTSVFPYIAEPVIAAVQGGCPTIEINPSESEVSHIVRHRLQMGAAEALPALVAALRGPA